MMCGIGEVLFNKPIHVMATSWASYTTVRAVHVPSGEMCCLPLGCPETDQELNFIQAFCEVSSFATLGIFNTHPWHVNIEDWRICAGLQ